MTEDEDRPPPSVTEADREHRRQEARQRIASIARHLPGRLRAELARRMREET